MKTGVRKAIAGLLIVTMTSASVPAWAGTISTDNALDSDRERILVLVDRPEVQADLEAHGVSPAAAKARIAALSDAEVRRLAEQIDSAPAGARDPRILLLPVYIVIGAVYLVALLVGGLISLAAYTPEERRAAREEKRAAERAAQEEERAAQRAAFEEKRAAREAKRAARAAKRANKRSAQALSEAVLQADFQGETR